MYMQSEILFWLTERKKQYDIQTLVMISMMTYSHVLYSILRWRMQESNLQLEPHIHSSQLKLCVLVLTTGFTEGRSLIGSTDHTTSFGDRPVKWRIK